MGKRREDKQMKIIPDGKWCLKRSLERNDNLLPLFLKQESHHSIMPITMGASIPLQLSGTLTELTFSEKPQDLALH